MGTRWVPGENTTRLRSLDATQPPELVGGHPGGIAAEADLAGSAADEADTVGVERLVQGGGARLGADERNLASGGLGDGGGDLALLAGTEVLDDRGLHGELDQVEREEPDDVLKNWESATARASKMSKNVPRPKRYQSSHRRWSGSE